MGRFELAHNNEDIIRKTGDMRGWGLAEYARKRTARNERKILRLLKQNGGYCKLSLLHQQFSEWTITRLMLQRKIWKVSCNLGRGTGPSKRFIHQQIFNEGFFPYSYACLGRTGVVRFLQSALKRPTDETQKTLTAFLRGYVTQAEKFAVLWKLGIQWYDPRRVKDSIQIDGVVPPRGTFRGVGV